MEKKANKKFIIAIAALAMVVCLAVGGLVGVLAAQAQQVKSTFNVQYTIGENIAGKISANYKVASDAAVDLVTGITTNDDATAYDDTKVIAFDTTTEEHGAGSISAYALNAEAESISLSPSKTSVVFTYTFENTGATAFNVTLTDGAVAGAKNVTVTYAVSDNDDDTTDADLSATAGFRVAAGKTAQVTITVSVEDSNKAEGNYTSAEGAGLVWNLSYVA